MKTVFRRALLVITATILTVSFTACKGSAGNGSDHKEPGKGAQKGMNTYNIGRFSIDVPTEMKEAGRTHEFRYAEIEEFLWPKNVDREEARKEAWARRIAEINSNRPPRGIKKIIVETKESLSVGKWSKGVLYYGNDMSSKDGFWMIMADYGQVGAIFIIKGLIEYEEPMFDDLLEIARNYEPMKQDKVDSFHTAYGNITLPYLEQESSYVRFEGHPLDLMLEIEMTETNNVEESGPVERLAAAISTNFAPTVDVKKIRARKKNVAGLEGEELVVRLTDGGESELHFGWEYAGKQDSGEYPLIQIEMESPDGRVEEKLKVWDAILGSMKSLYKGK
ncbi:hypothetical protein GeomeDRAFT_2620 [Geobacter metallireducens RCH3]|uniref:Lipoprotein, putative n=1 Tax=Geobacter metallireducens (strain ATCC 53774 / DSM 7210 / GS-15) TaxID=269799 RepID=Q39YZ0_GEOMG|nr:MULTISPECIES: T6SS immunity protein Tli4 family protein [Geobacter]ABB30534.1 lipoprotein, putative [Geobacter metallireducens GS-15]EHP85208.1 hypothetical protein GeomeDRAFT_2620 [Geobacter metallireducens RCH3]MBT1076331.1 hypothetical protein [Geobacter grbiciae]